MPLENVDEDSSYITYVICSVHESQRTLIQFISYFSIFHVYITIHKYIRKFKRTIKFNNCAKLSQKVRTRTRKIIILCYHECPKSRHLKIIYLHIQSRQLPDSDSVTPTSENLSVLFVHVQYLFHKIYYSVYK